MKNLDYDNAITTFSDAARIFDEKMDITGRGKTKRATVRILAIRKFIQLSIKSEEPKVLGDLMKFMERVDRAIYEGLGEVVMKIIVEGGLPYDDPSGGGATTPSSTSVAAAARPTPQTSPIAKRSRPPHMRRASP